MQASQWGHTEHYPPQPMHFTTFPYPLCLTTPQTPMGVLPGSLNINAPPFTPSGLRCPANPVRIRTPNRDALTFEGQIPPPPKVAAPIHWQPKRRSVVVRVESEQQKHKRLAKEKAEKEKLEKERKTIEEELKAREEETSLEGKELGFKQKAEQNTRGVERESQEERKVREEAKQKVEKEREVGGVASKANEEEERKAQEKKERQLAERIARKADARRARKAAARQARVEAEHKAGEERKAEGEVRQKEANLKTEEGVLQVNREKDNKILGEKGRGEAGQLAGKGTAHKPKKALKQSLRGKQQSQAKNMPYLFPKNKTLTLSIKFSDLTWPKPPQTQVKEANSTAPIASKQQTSKPLNEEKGIEWEMAREWEAQMEWEERREREAGGEWGNYVALEERTWRGHGKGKGKPIMWTGLNLAATLILLAAAGTNAQQKVRKNHTIEQTVPLRTHSIYAPYVDQDLQNRWFSFGGNAYVNTNKHIRLTRDKPSQAGWLWSRLPLTASSYQIIVEFKVSGGSSHLYGDGFAMWLTDTRAQPGPVFGSIDKFVGLGVFVDTYANSRHTYAFPRIMAMLGDGKTSYDLGNDGASNELAACSANIRKTDIATKIKLTYFKDEYLNVQLQYKGWDEWTECFTVYEVSLPNSPYLGFSAHTGDVSDNHDIISVSTASAILADAPINMPTKKSGSSSGFWSFLSFLIKLAGVSLFGVAALAGYRAYARNATRRGGGLGGLGSGMPRWDNKHF